MKIKSFFKDVYREIKGNRITYFVFLSLFLIVVIILGVNLISRNSESIFLCLLTLILLFVPFIIEVIFHIQLPSRLEIILLCFIFGAEILGGVIHFYDRISFWDMLLHITSGFLCTAIGLSLIEFFSNKPELESGLSPLFIIMVAFCFSMTVGVFWEFFEFGSDQLLLTDMQKDSVVNSIVTTILDPSKQNIRTFITGIKEISINGELIDVSGYIDIGLFDTMQDLFSNFIGAVIFSIYGFFSSKYNNKKFIKDWLIIKDNKK